MDIVAGNTSGENSHKYQVRVSSAVKMSDWDKVDMFVNIILASGSKIT